MAYFDSIKIGGTIKQVQVVQELNALPSPVLETSPQLVKIGNDLYIRESKMGGAYGTYRFMLVPTNQQVHSVNFISNGKTFGEIIINASGEMAYNSTLVYSNGNWVNEAYKTIAIFNSSYSSGLVDFLNNNAEKIIDGYYKYIKVSSEGGSVVLEKDVSTTGGNLAFADDITMEEFDTLWNNEFIMLNILTGTTEFTSQTLLKKVRQGTAGATPVMSMVFTQVQPTNETTINYAELTISRDTSDDYISSEFKMYDITSGSPKIVNLNEFVPSTATQGTLTVGALNVLQQSNENYIVFNNEIFRLADKQHNAGFLVYSHNGHDKTGCFFQKCITITLLNRAWVLKTQENQAKLTAGSNITIENNVISATGGSGTSDTAYVSDSTLYIEEGTTAGGGSNVLEIDLTPYMEQVEDATVFEVLLLGNYCYSIEDSSKPYVSLGLGFKSETIYNTLMNNDYDYIKFTLNYDADKISSPIYSLSEKIMFPDEDNIKSYSKPSTVWFFTPNRFKVDIMFRVIKLKNVETTYYLSVECILQNLDI